MAAAVGLATNAVGGVVAGAPNPALIATAAGAAIASMDAIAKAAADAQQSMGIVGAFATDSQAMTESAGGAGGGAVWTPEQSQAWYAQWTPDSGGGGGGGGG